MLCVYIVCVCCCAYPVSFSCVRLLRRIVFAFFIPRTADDERALWRRWREILETLTRCRVGHANNTHCPTTNQPTNRPTDRPTVERTQHTTHNTRDRDRLAARANARSHATKSSGRIAMSTTLQDDDDGDECDVVDVVPCVVVVVVAPRYIIAPRALTYSGRNLLSHRACVCFRL